jgi:hypothetical protein
MNWKDFEDAVQAACAAKAEVDYLVTRNPSDFSGSELDVVTPAEVAAVLASGSISGSGPEVSG